jgi:hypothetical protein
VRGANGLQSELNRMIAFIDGNVCSAQENLQMAEEKYIRNGLYAEVFAWLGEQEKPLFKFVPNNLCTECIRDLYSAGELTDRSWIARVPVYDESREQDIVLVYLRNLKAGGRVWELKGITTGTEYDADAPVSRTLGWLNSANTDNDWVIEERVKKIKREFGTENYEKLRKEIQNGFSEEEDKRSAETLLLFLTFGNSKQRHGTVKNN